MTSSPQPDIESLLDAWHEHGWPFRTRPRLRGILPGGRCNRSYLLDGDGAACVLRLGGAGGTLPGVDRTREAAVLAVAGAAGLAPVVIHTDRAQDILLYHYVSGHQLSATTLDADAKAALYAGLARVHALPCRPPDLDYRRHLVALARAAGQTADVPTAFEAALGRLHRAQTRALCHHDPTPGNIVFDAGRVVFLDWEYAAPGLPALDYAALAVDWGLPIPELAQESGMAAALLEDAIVVYAAICGRWQAGLAART